MLRNGRMKYSLRWEGFPEGSTDMSRWESLSACFRSSVEGEIKRTLTDRWAENGTKQKRENSVLSTQGGSQRMKSVFHRMTKKGS